MNWDIATKQIGSHVVAIPYPGRGHINPMMNLCHSLASQTTNTTVFTFVVTEEWFGFLSSDSNTTFPSNVRFVTIPNVIPSELVRAAVFQEFFIAVQTKMEEPFEQLLNGFNLPVTMIIADTFVGWAPEVGNRRNIPVASFFPSSALTFSMFYHFNLLVQNHHCPLESSVREDECVNYIPGISSMTVADLPAFCRGQITRGPPVIIETISRFSTAQYLLFSSIYQLETKAIDALKAKLPMPVYTVGPNIPYFKLQNNPTSNTDLSYMQWLDSKPPRTVLYVSLGSFLSVSSAQMEEIAAGLRDSEVAYLWVTRREASSHVEEAGLVVPWCDQLRVLCHSSIGGFWTHCGWNSVKESIFAGVPMITFPIALDQTTNRRQVVKDWMNGWRFKVDVGPESLVRREEITKLVRRFMDLESDERKELTRRAKELQEVSRQAIEKGGSSDMNLDAFIVNIEQ